MAVQQHPSGLHKAYKKINGFEYQYYYKHKSSADKKQRELDALAALKPKKVFANDGRLLGFRIKAHYRYGHLAMCMQLTVEGKRKTKQITCNQAFETVWKQTKRWWREHHELDQDCFKTYAKELKAAKRLYLNDLSRCTHGNA